MTNEPSPEAGKKFLEDRGYRFATEYPQWRLPHSLYRPTQLELRVMKHLKITFLETRPEGEWARCRDWGWSQEAMDELRFQSYKPITCHLGLHSYETPVVKLGPQTALEMHERSGSFVLTYFGQWKTCMKCRHQRLADDNAIRSLKGSQ